MKTNFTRLLLFAALFFTILQASAQAVGDFRTNFATAVAQWTTVGSWQQFDGTTWVAASAFPTSADGVITIQAGDSLQLSGATSNISIDQVVIEPGGILALLNNTGGAVTLNNGAGDDISVNGRMYVAGAANLTGTGNIHVNSGGLFTLRNTGILGAPVTNDGTMHLGASGVSAGTVSATTMTNNTQCFWIDGNANLSNGASFVNNGTLEIQATGAAQWNNTTGTNTISNTGTITKTGTNTIAIATSFSNSGTGIVNLTGTAGGISFTNSTAGAISNAGTLSTASGTTFTFNNLTNSGTLAGNGTFAFTTAVGTNTGIISPGTSPGILTIGPSAITSKTPTINIELATDGAVAGVNYDQLALSAGAFITGTTLNVINTTTTADPVGTTYTILTGPVGNNIIGPFATTNLASNYTITYNPTSVVLTKIALFPLPVTWGEFKALAQGSKVLLDWTTLMEENTSHFVVEHSTSGSTYTPVANIEARGNSTYEANYKYTFASPDLTKANYFRIKQVDLDGKSTYSVTRSVKFDKGQVVAIQAYPNPVKDVLTLNIQRENIQVLLADQTGKTIQRLNVQPGQHSINMQSLPSGIYQLAVFEKGVRIETKQIMKQ